MCVLKKTKHPGHFSWICLGEDYLTAGRLLVKLAHRDGAIHLFAEVVFFDVEHIHDGAAGIDLAARIVNHGDEFTDRRNVYFLNLFSSSW